MTHWKSMQMKKNMQCGCMPVHQGREHTILNEGEISIEEARTSYNRGRSNYHNNYHNNNNHNDNYENHNQNYHTGRGHQSNRGTNNRGRERQVNAVVTEPPRQTQQEEDVANVIDLFRD